MKQKIGLIGLGIMGSAMTKNLLKAGYPVTVFNRTASKADSLVKEGAVLAKNPRDLASSNDVVMVIVTDPDAVWDVLQGPVGVLAASGKGKTLIQLSTLDVESTLAIAKEAKAKGYDCLDCPVSGSKKQVDEAVLILNAGGEKEVLERARPILLSIGKHIVHAGPVGAGTALKLCINLIVAQMTTGLCEAVALAEGLKIGPKSIFEVLENSPALNCAYYKIKKEFLLSKKFPPTFSLANMLKDVRFMNKEAKANALTLPVNQAVQALMEKALTQDLANEDLTAISKVL